VRGGERGVRAQASGHNFPLPPSSGSVQVRQLDRYPVDTQVDGASGAYSGLHAVRGGERGVCAQASGHYLPLPPSSGSVQVRQLDR
jgi:hypothetical protein